MGHRLRHIAFTRKPLRGKRLFPMGRGDQPSLGQGLGVIALDLQVVSSGLLKINRIGKMGFVRSGDRSNPVFLFMIKNIPVCSFDFLALCDPKPVVVVMRLVGSVGPPFVHDQAPIGIGMFEDRLAMVSLHDLQSQQLGKNRQRLVQRPTLIMAVDQSYGFEHKATPRTQKFRDFRRRRS